MKNLILTFSLLLSPFSLFSQSLPEALFTRAERTQYLETSLNADVLNFIDALQNVCPLVTVETITTTKLGNPLKLVIMANPRITSPEEARKSGKPVIYIQGNIHAGEVEGKEAAMQLMREIALGPKKYLLDNQIVMFCPNYNPDGNDKLGENRPTQEGSPKLTGVRSNGEGMDLNREGMKAESAEMKGLLKNVLLRWDPALLVDLHADNGTWHGYIDNIAPAFQSTGMPGPVKFTTGIIQDAIEKVLLRSGMPIYWHGYLDNRPGKPATYSAYDHLPRYISNYVGLRNRMGILSETFPHDRFEKRILSNYYVILTFLEYTNSHAKEITEMIRQADQATIDLILAQAGTLQKGITYELAPEPEMISMLMRETKRIESTGGGRPRFKPTGRFYYIDSIQHYNHFVPVKLGTVPRTYIFPGEFVTIAEKLQEHGILIQKTSKKIKIAGEEFLISKFTPNKRQGYFGGQKTETIEGEYRTVKKTIPAGSYYVDLAQPLAWLIFYLLEPQSDDGLLYWNFFDEYLLKCNIEKGRAVYPVLKTTQEL
ncbi:MAG: M14 family metallopeptidase [Bacteroidota bacterium]